MAAYEIKLGLFAEEVLDGTVNRPKPPRLLFVDLAKWQEDEQTVTQLCRQLSCARKDLLYALLALQRQLAAVNEQTEQLERRNMK